MTEDYSYLAHVAGGCTVILCAALRYVCYDEQQTGLKFQEGV